MKKFLWLCLWLCAVLVAVSGAAFVYLWSVTPLELERITRIDGSPALYDAEGRLIHMRLSPDYEWQVPIPIEDMGRWLPVVAVGAEDGRFYSHPGVDVIALLRATVQLTSGHVVSGASTITSQLVRMAISERERGMDTTDPGKLSRRPRNVATKAREFILALKLERCMSKKEILENYLNRAPFGGNVRGVQAASFLYFGKPAAKLSPGEACLLIGMLKGPTLYRPDTRPEAARSRRDFIIGLMERKGVFDHDTARRALLEELPRRRFSMPQRAWHFSEMAFQNGLDGRRVSLKQDVQSQLESILRQAARELPSNITIAAGVAENRTASIAAWVGNARFDTGSADEKGRWIDCGRAPRSPGSTLKPFAYLCAIEQGLLTPSSLLADTPMAFSGRAPRNFDLQYRGAVSARVALYESLNAPAARVLRMAGQEKTLALLREAGLKHLTQPASYYGDSLILGGCEVTLFEELEAFTALANLGLHRPLSLEAGEGTNAIDETQIASRAGCWLICDMLDHRGPLTLLSRGTLGQQWHAALKTGTSYGLRDAWCAAWTPDFTAVVWVGNPDGSPWPGLVGAQAAAPIAMRILRAVSPRSGGFERPDGLSLLTVCSLSGQPPTAACPSTRMDWQIDGVTRTVPCSMHTIRGGHTALMWPAKLGSVPPSRGAIPQRAPLTIASPLPGSVYISSPFAPQRVPMRAEGATGRVYWYLDGKFIGESLPDETFFHEIGDGEHVIGAMDAAGRSASVKASAVTPGKKKKPVQILR